MNPSLKYDSQNYICDAHCDTLLNIAEGFDTKLVNAYNTSRSSPFIQLYAIWTDNGEGLISKAAAGHYGISQDDVFGYVKRCSGDYFGALEAAGLTHCGSFGDVAAAISSRSNISMPALEGSGFIDSLDKLHYVCEVLKIRFMMLTWNPSNILAAGAGASFTDEDTGVTAYGREFLAECEKLGVAIDLSHASFNTMQDVLTYFSGPVFASHSNFYSVTKHRRNLPDDVAGEIRRRGGFIGLNTYLPFVREGTSDFSLYKAGFIMDHVEYALANGYGDVIGFGFDIDGMEGYPCDIDLDKSIHDQYVEMLAGQGCIDGELLDKVKGGNFISFLKRMG